MQVKQRHNSAGIILPGSARGIRLILTTILLCALQACSAQPAQHISAGDNRLTYMGRTEKTDSGTLFYWPGTSVQMNFEGAEVAASLRDENGANYYYCIIDGGIPQKIKPDSGYHLTELHYHLAAGRHTIQLFRLTEAKFGRTYFCGFNIAQNATVIQPPAIKRAIEFYGNSITCGYSLEDTLKDSGKPEYENNYYSYAAITAHHFNARYTCIAKSGIGIMLSWFPIIMPEMYDRLAPEDSVRKWDFNQFTPQVVVINLGQNDSWLIEKPGHAQFRARFGTSKPGKEQIINAYKTFFTTIRNKYPRAAIICALGSMDATKEGSPWPGYITSAAASMHDPQVFTLFFPYKNTPGHPKKSEQEQMAGELIKFIDTNVVW